MLIRHAARATGINRTQMSRSVCLTTTNLMLVEIGNRFPQPVRRVWPEIQWFCRIRVDRK